MVKGKVTNWVKEVGLRLEEGFFRALFLSCFRKPTSVQQEKFLSSRKELKLNAIILNFNIAML